MLGLVDTDPPPVAYGLPPVLQSGTVTKVHVKDGDEVQTGKELYEFDNTIQKADVKQADAAVATAVTKVAEAQEGAKQHAENVKVADQVVDAADRKMKLTKQYYILVEKNLETFYKSEKIPEADWPERKKGDSNLYEANVKYDSAVIDLNTMKAKRDQLKAADPQVKVKEAEAAVEQAKAQLAKAQSVVDLCVVKAKLPGTIEQVSIGAGSTIGVGTRARRCGSSRPGRGSSAPRSRPSSPTASARTSPARRSPSPTTPTPSSPTPAPSAGSAPRSC